MKPRLLRSLEIALRAALVAGALYVVVAMYAAGAIVLGTCALALVALAAYVFSARRAVAARYLFPGLFGVAAFIVLPLVYTVWIAFSRYSSDNLVTFERATATLLSRTVRKGEAGAYVFTLHRDGASYRLALEPEEDGGPDGGPDADEPGEDAGQDSIFGEPGDEAPAQDEASIFDEPTEDAGPSDAGADAAAVDAGPPAAGAASAGEPAPAAPPSRRVVTEPFALGGAAVKVAAKPLTAGAPPLGAALELRDIVTLQPALAKVVVTLPGGEILVSTGLRSFAAEIPAYRAGAAGQLIDAVTQTVYTANFDTGFYQSARGERLIPGFRGFAGGQHFARIFTDPAFRGPTLRVFAWTVTFAGLSVLFTLLVGAILAELFSWEALRLRTMYRLLLFIPYAVPSFISILIFKGLFNEGFGEINVALSHLLGVSPKWFTDPLAAKAMILIVNTWLGFPYMMLLCMGLKQSIPKDLYEAAALAGAGPFRSYLSITWPLIRKPLLPLLIASFAFNFNNAVLINLLTDGRPDIIGARLPAGTNDLLVTLNWRIAFQDANKDYGLAAAIATVVFVIVAILSLINLRLTRAAKSDVR